MSSLTYLDKAQGSLCSDSELSTCDACQNTIAESHRISSGPSYDIGGKTAPFVKWQFVGEWYIEYGRLSYLSENMIDDLGQS